MKYFCKSVLNCREEKSYLCKSMYIGFTIKETQRHMWTCTRRGKSPWNDSATLCCPLHRCYVIASSNGRSAPLCHYRWPTPSLPHVSQSRPARGRLHVQADTGWMIKCNLLLKQCWWGIWVDFSAWISCPHILLNSYTIEKAVKIHCKSHNQHFHSYHLIGCSCRGAGEILHTIISRHTLCLLNVTSGT